VTRACLVLVAVLSPAAVMASEGELSLPPREAFAIGARTRVLDAQELNPAAFNRELAQARARKEAWTESFIQVALRFTRAPGQGQKQSVEMEATPSGWEGLETLKWARVTIDDRGYHDDSVSGERWIVWLVPSPRGGLEVARGLRAWECQRSPESWFYSARACP
jgi:hypothetical protein